VPFLLRVSLKEVRAALEGQTSERVKGAPYLFLGLITFRSSLPEVAGTEGVKGGRSETDGAIPPPYDLSAALTIQGCSL
jgi:hypothetical protein